MVGPISGAPSALRAGKETRPRAADMWYEARGLFVGAGSRIIGLVDSTNGGI
jgi:hypothetical protein